MALGGSRDLEKQIIGKAPVEPASVEPVETASVEQPRSGVSKPASGTSKPDPNLPLDFEAVALAKKPWYQRIPGVAVVRSSHGLQRLMLMIGIVIVAVFVLMAIFAPLLAPYRFNAIFTPQLAPGGEHLLGTTVGGYDVLSRVIYGARTAIEVILMAVVLSIVVGVPLGVVSGYIGSALDRVLVLIMDALYAFPSLLLAIVVSIMVAQGRSGSFVGILSAAVAITVVFVPQYFRVTRNATMSAKQLPYVDAAKVAGANPGRIMFRHILPNVSQSIPVLMTLNASESILTLASLGFLGFGIEPNSAAEWGYDLNRARADVTNGIWWTALFPGLAIVLIILGVTLIGESMNDILNPLLRTRGGDSSSTDEQEIAEAVEASAAATPVVTAMPLEVEGRYAGDSATFDGRELS
jgi:ABC-type dipeptide/oligopeptide/nickel transport system permease subunit